MNDAELCLAIDLGTGGPKVGLVASTGEVLAHEVHRVATTLRDDGTATQDAHEWWRIVADAARRLVATVSPDRVAAVGVTGQYASTVPVDANGVPTGPCLTWLDTRGGRYTRAAVGGPFQGYRATTVVRFVRKTAGAPSTAGADPVGHLLFLTHEQPEVVAATRWFLEPVDYLTMRLTGVASATHASRLAMWMTDTRNLTHYRYDPALLDLVGLSDDKLPPLVPFGSLVGTLAPAVAADLGLAASTVVATGVPDLHAAALGAGATDLFSTHLALSTTSWISCPVPAKKTDIAHAIAAVPGLSNDSYLVINNQETGAKALEWLQTLLAGAGEPPSLSAMTELAGTSPPGAHGVTFTPWLAGERSPREDKGVRGGFADLSLTTSRADLVRAVLEGVAANSAWLFAHVEKFAGTTLTPVRLLGGGAQSDLWCQIYADTLGRDVEQVVTPLLAQLRGAGLLAFAALAGRSPREAPRPAPGRVFAPGPDSAVSRERAARLPALFKRAREVRGAASPGESAVERPRRGR